jgi:NTP pyrophosphatase (non-canonical NTP hydrolase)
MPTSHSEQTPADQVQRLASAMTRAKQLHAIAAEVTGEVSRAEAQWPPMNSAHEAYAVLLEEVDELWEHVKTKQSKRDIPAMRKEALQVAAMAIRFARDICDGGRGRK